MRTPSNRSATHPGEVSREDFLVPLGLTQKQLADSINVSFQRANEIVSGKRGLTPGTALRLAKCFGNSPDFCLNLQMHCDLQAAKKKEQGELKRIRPTRKLAA
jgi:antitoxin HigA-1